MKSKISAFMDGELAQRDADGALESLLDEGDAREVWRRYHLIGDLMRDPKALSGRSGAGVSSRVAERIAQEPTVLAPSRRRIEAARMPVWALSAAASLAAVTLVGWVAFGPREEAQLATSPPPAPVAQEAAQVAPPAAADDYLLAHQGYSPRISLQGAAPYVRTVSGAMHGPGR